MLFLLYLYKNIQVRYGIGGTVGKTAGLQDEYVLIIPHERMDEWVESLILDFFGFLDIVDGEYIHE